MAKRNLTDEELAAAANKQWKQTPIFTSDEKLASRAKNLTGPKTVEGKINSLKNLRAGGTSSTDKTNISHGGYVRRILNEDEADLYDARKAIYIRDFDLNESSDEILLHTLLMDEVIYYRLQKRLADHPSDFEKVERPLNECTGRISRALEDLGTKRKQRLKQDEKVHSISIATVSQQFFRELMAGNIDNLLQDNLDEEVRFLEDKKKRDARDMIDADYEIVEEDDSNVESES